MPLLKSTANLKTVVLINSNIGVAKVGNLAYKLKKRDPETSAFRF